MNTTTTETKPAGSLHPVVNNYWRGFAMAFALLWGLIYFAQFIARMESRHWAFTWFVMHMIWWRIESRKIIVNDRADQREASGPASG